MKRNVLRWSFLAFGLFVAVAIIATMFLPQPTKGLVQTITYALVILLIIVLTQITIRNQRAEIDLLRRQADDYAKRGVVASMHAQAYRRAYDAGMSQLLMRAPGSTVNTIRQRLAAEMDQVAAAAVAMESDERTMGA